MNDSIECAIADVPARADEVRHRLTVTAKGRFEVRSLTQAGDQVVLASEWELQAALQQAARQLGRSLTIELSEGDSH
jgi:hypothetical protein